jgi:superfamily II DNA/RNA helicase
VQGLTYHTTVSSIAVFGGVEMTKQEQALKANVDIVVATPGRLMDHMRHEAVNFGALEVLVLDEADRMLDMGFWPDVQRILAALPAVRQTLLFSATMPAEVLKLTKEFLRDPKYVQVGRRGARRRLLRTPSRRCRRARRRHGSRAGCARRRPALCSCSAGRRSARIAWRRS